MRWNASTRVLADPGVTVIFDEADLAAQRDGWDAARWVRHLAAKLNRHEDVLPPGSENEGDWQPSPGPLPSFRDAAALDIGKFADEAQERAVEVPRDDGPAAVQLEDNLAGDLVLETFGDGTDGDPAPPEPEYDMAGDLRPGRIRRRIGKRAGMRPTPADEPDADDLRKRAGTGRCRCAVRIGGRFRRCACRDCDPLPRQPTRDIDLEALEQRAAGLSLADVDSYGHGPLRGAVLVEGGLGGPDAVRQLLAGIPEGFPRPVLVRLQLDGGRYDRLVKQMERAARLPVALAETGQGAEAGTIYFVPPGMSLVQDRTRLVFVDGDAGSQPHARRTSRQRQRRAAAERQRRCQRRHGDEAGVRRHAGRRPGAGRLLRRCRIDRTDRTRRRHRHARRTRRATRRSLAVLRPRRSMNTSSQDGTPSQDIRGVLIQIEGARLLLPNATIAEVLSYADPEPVENAPDWLLGRIRWRGWQLPLVSFARIAGIRRRAWRPRQQGRGAQGAGRRCQAAAFRAADAGLPAPGDGVARQRWCSMPTTAMRCPRACRRACCSTTMPR